MKSRWFGLAAIIIVLALSSAVFVLAAPTLGGTKSDVNSSISNNSSSTVTTTTSSVTSTNSGNCNFTSPTTADVVKGAALAEADPEFKTMTAGYRATAENLGWGCTPNGPLGPTMVFDLHAANGTIVELLNVQENPTLSYVIQMSLAKPSPIIGLEVPAQTITTTTMNSSTPVLTTNMTRTTSSSS
jgi:hypothetical protein